MVPIVWPVNTYSWVAKDRAGKNSVVPMSSISANINVVIYLVSGMDIILLVLFVLFGQSGPKIPD